MTRIIYKAKIDQIFFPEGKITLLENNEMNIKLKSGTELAEKNPVAFYYDSPHYVLTIEVTDLKEKRSYIEFKEEAEKILFPFSKWLTDIHGIKVSRPVFYQGYLNSNEVGALGQNIVGSEHMTLYNLPKIKEVRNNEIDDIFNELDVTNGKLAYLIDSEKFFENRRDIFLSKDTVGGFISLYGFMQEVIGKSTQKEIDTYIREHTAYNRKNDRLTTKPGKSFKETIFTWLRNQIGHVDPITSDYQKVISEINEWYDEFYEITLIALRNKY